MAGLERLEPAVLSTCVARKICLIKPSSLGDVVQTLPVLHGLRSRFPKAHIAWVVNKSYSPLIWPISAIDEIIEFDREGCRGRGFGAASRFGSFLKYLRAQRFDLALDLQGLLRSGMMCLATGARLRIGLMTAREGARFFCTHWIDDRPVEQGAVVRYWKVLEQFGIGQAQKSFGLELTDEERGEAKKQLSGLMRPIIAINPGARWETKRWPAEKFANAVGRTIRQNGFGSVVVLGGPGEELFAEQVVSQLGMPARNLCGKTSLRQLAALLAECDLLVTNDSGPMHLAAAVGTKTVSIFTCTSPARAAPFGEGHRIVQTKVWCKESYVKTCNRMECMDDVSIEPVMHEIETSLNLRTSSDPKASRAA